MEPPRVRTATKVCIFGANAYGLALAKLFCSRSNFGVMVFDQDVALIENLRAIHDDVTCQYEHSISRVFNNNVFIFTETIDLLPDVAKEANPGSFLIIECTIPIGTTRKLQREYLDRFTVGYSPIRWDQDRGSPLLKYTEKLVTSGNGKLANVIHNLYSQIFTKVIQIDTPEIVEASKLLEVGFRTVNVAFINEFADMCKENGIDTHKVIDAATTKPYGFMEFTPGLGMGGPYQDEPTVLLKEQNASGTLLEKSIDMLTQRPIQMAIEMAKDVPNSILVVGVGYKQNSTSFENSPVTEFIERMKEHGKKVYYFDPFISDYPHAERLELPIVDTELDHILVVHPYMISYFSTADFNEKVTFACQH